MPWAEVAAHARALERWLLPPACLLCGGNVPGREDDALACTACRLRWAAVPPPWCERCGASLDGPACAECLAWPETDLQVRSAVVLAGGAQRAVHLLKYEGWRRLAAPMGAAMWRAHPPPPGTVLVPMPLGARRHRQRGYNQAEELARGLAAAAGGRRVMPGLLARVRETATQTKLTPEARRANVHGAFRAPDRLPDAPLVLVDDVYTTGATLLAAAEGLLAAGASTVRAVTFARAPGPLGTPTGP